MWVALYVRWLFAISFYAWRGWVLMSFLTKLRSKLANVITDDGVAVPDENGIYKAVKDQWVAIVTAYQGFREDNVLTLAEAWELFSLGIASLVKLAQQVGGANADKKAAVLRLAADFYDDVVAPYDISFVPNWFEPLVDGFLKKVWMVLADGAINAAVATLKDNDMVGS